MASDNFLNIELQADKLDRYYVRTSILNALQNHLHFLKGTFLDVGCGQMPYKPLILSKQTKVTRYVGLDLTVSNIHNTTVADLLWDGKSMPLDNATIDSAMATEVLEHCPEPEVVLREVLRVLKPGGAFFFTVPFLWPLHEVPYDEYRYTPFSLERHIKNAGFSHVEIKALGGWDASLAQMLGLWVRRRPMSPMKKEILSSLLKPFIKVLIDKDIKPSLFTDSTMITGITGIAIK